MKGIGCHNFAPKSKFSLYIQHSLIFLLFIFKDIFTWKAKRDRRRENEAICWLTSQLTTTPRVGQDKSQESKTPSRFPWGCHMPRGLDYLFAFSGAPGWSRIRNVAALLYVLSGAFPTVSKHISLVRILKLLCHDTFKC